MKLIKIPLHIVLYLLHTSSKVPFRSSGLRLPNLSLTLQNIKKDYQQEADFERAAKTSGVRISLGSKVYAIVNQVDVAIADNGSYDFKENIYGSFTCS